MAGAGAEGQSASQASSDPSGRRGGGRLPPGLYVVQVAREGREYHPDDSHEDHQLAEVAADRRSNGGGVHGYPGPEAMPKASLTVRRSPGRPRQVHPSSGTDLGWSVSPDSVHKHPCDAALGDANDAVRTAVRRILVPYMAAFVIYGVVPMRMNPSRLSLHPWRSTLLYVLAVQVLVAVSAHTVFGTYRELLNTEAESAAGVDSRLLAAQSVLHVSSHAIVIITWFEIPRLHQCVGAAREFVALHAHMFGASGEVRFSRLTRALPWLTVVFCFVVAPVIVGAWCFYILPSENSVMHSFSHLYQVVFVTGGVSLFAVCCTLLRDLAVDLSTKLREELEGGHNSAMRLEEFRLAWMGLRAMAACLGALPLSGLGVLAYLLVMITLSAYQTVVSYSNSYAILFVSSCTMFLLCQVSVLTIFDSAHRLSDEMTQSFYQPLAARSWRKLPPDLLAEHQQFLATISNSPPEVSFAGMVTIRRSTYLSMMAAITTYLIVLFQLRQSDEELPARPHNASTPDLDKLIKLQ